MPKLYLFISAAICFFMITAPSAMAGPIVQWGLQGDIPVPADYDGDGTQELAVWRPANGTWYISTANRSWNQRGGDVKIVQWGMKGDIPVPADYDGDGTQELAVWRPANGTWYISTANRAWNQRGGDVRVVQWGLKGDIPVPADYDGDGTQELAVWRPANGTWYISTANRAWNQRGGDVRVVQWGLKGDIPVPADYDGDGTQELAVWRPVNGSWYISTANRAWSQRGGDVKVVQWGLKGDIPVPADYDGDDSDELAVWRPANGTWYISTANHSWSQRGGDVKVVQWGLKGDIPVPADYDGDDMRERAVWRPAEGNWYLSTN